MANVQMARIYIHNNKLVSLGGAVLASNLGSVTPPPSYTDEQYFTFDTELQRITAYNIAGGTDVVIPPTIGGLPVLGLHDDALYDLGLTSVVLPQGIEYIGSYSLAENQLISITIPSSVLEISDSAFEENNISSVIIPDSVIYIGIDAFKGVTNITLGSGYNQYWYANTNVLRGSIGTNGNFPRTVNSVNITIVEESSFYKHPFTELTLPEGYLEIRDNAFEHPGTITELTLPSTLSIIGSSAFATQPGESDHIEYVSLGNNVTVGSAAFRCHPITTIVIGSNCTLSNFQDAPFGLYGFDFVALYNSNGKLAGTYTYSGGVWTKTA